MHRLGVVLLLWGVLVGLAGAEGRMTIIPNAVVRGEMWVEMLNPEDVGFSHGVICLVAPRSILMASHRSPTHYTVLVVHAATTENGVPCPLGTMFALPKVVYEDLLHAPASVAPGEFAAGAVGRPAETESNRIVYFSPGDYTMQQVPESVGWYDWLLGLPVWVVVMGCIVWVVGGLCGVAWFVEWAWRKPPDDDIARMDQMIADLGRMRETVDAVLGASVHRPGSPSLQDMTETFLRANRVAVEQRRERARARRRQGDESRSAL